uniref:Nucleic-acid-binding protein n=1 Tax=Schizaphis graminum TaxID=13262 RepID=A0A2S2NS45_SCHGA
MPRSHSKRILSIASISPLREGKKPKKCFTSPNKFAVLASSDFSDDAVFDTESLTRADSVENPPHSTVCSEPMAPPIYISDIANFSAFKDKLIKITGPKGFTCKSTSSHLIVRPNGVQNFNDIITYLKETNASFHSFRPRCLRPYRIVIRNLHHTTLSGDISAALSEEGYSVKRIHNLKKNNRPLPIFFVDLDHNVNNNQIYNIKSLLNTKIVIEKPNKTTRGPPQCFNCQNFGHTVNYCRHPPRCVKCSEAHSSGSCTKDRSSPARCVHCSGDHTANFRGCPAFKKAIKKKIRPSKSPATKVPESQPFSRPKSYAEATQTQDVPNENFSVTLSNFIINLNSLISPLIPLLSSVLDALISKVNLSP